MDRVAAASAAAAAAIAAAAAPVRLVVQISTWNQIEEYLEYVNDLYYYKHISGWVADRYRYMLIPISFGSSALPQKNEFPYFLRHLHYNFILIMNFV